MTWGELAMLLAPRGEAIGRRIQKIRETGTAQHANWGAMDWCAEQGILKYAMDPDGAVSSLPSAYFARPRALLAGRSTRPFGSEPQGRGGDRKTERDRRDRNGVYQAEPGGRTGGGHH